MHYIAWTSFVLYPIFEVKKSLHSVVALIYFFLEKSCQIPREGWGSLFYHHPSTNSETHPLLLFFLPSILPPFLPSLLFRALLLVPLIIAVKKGLRRRRGSRAGVLDWARRSLRSSCIGRQIKQLMYRYVFFTKESKSQPWKKSRLRLLRFLERGPSLACVFSHNLRCNAGNAKIMTPCALLLLRLLLHVHSSSSSDECSRKNCWVFWFCPFYGPCGPLTSKSSDNIFSRKKIKSRTSSVARVGFQDS